MRPFCLGVTMRCPTCGFDSPLEMKFCGMCGTLLTKVCPQCNAPNPQIYRFCGHCGAPFTKEDLPPTENLPALDIPVHPSHPPTTLRQLEGERRLATVLMADVHNSTVLLEKIGSEAWVNIMNQVLQMMEWEINRFGGKVDQFRGDGLVAFFGSVDVHEDDPERGVLAGLAIQQAIKGHASELTAQWGIDLRIRVGINTGDLILTSIGDEHNPQDTGMGSAVTVAARMEATAEPGTVLVSASTYRLTESEFEWLPLGKTMVKGLSQPLDTYRPLAHYPEGESQPAPPSQTQPSTELILRAEQARTLIEQVEHVIEGCGGIIMLSGEKGMGKSYLVRHVWQHFASQGKLNLIGGEIASESESERVQPSSPGVTLLRGYCHSFEQSSPYAMWQDVIHRWLQVHPDTNPEAIRERLRQKVYALGEAPITWIYPYLTAFLALPVEEEFRDWLAPLSVEELQRQVFLAVRSWLHALTQQGSLVLSLSYIQWADAASLVLLRYCISLCESDPLLWLFTLRPDRDSPAWGFSQYLETEFIHRLVCIELPPLSPEASRQMVLQILGKHRLADATLELVIQKTEGNPYFINEILQTLIEQEALQRDEHGQWYEAREIASFDLPDSLQGLLLSRIGRLAPEERQVLQIASVTGLIFWENVLQQITDNPAQLKAALKQLLKARFIQERHPSPELGMEYIFTSSLIRDVVYDGLLSSQRSQCHLKVATTLETSVRSESIKRYESILAYQYRQAHQPQKELFYTLLAATQAHQVFANSEATQHYTRALEILDELEAGKNPEQTYILHTQRFEVLDGRRSVFFSIGDFASGRADARRLLALADELADDPTWKIDALLAQPEVTSWANREELLAGTRMAQEALQLAQKLSDTQREMRSALRVATKLNLLKDPQWLQLMLSALEISRQLGDLRMEAHVLIEIGKAYGPDNLQEGVQYLQEAYAVSQKLDDKPIQLDLLQMLGAQFERQGDYYRYLTEYEQPRLKHSREIGRRMTEGHALMKCGQIQALYLGDYAGGVKLIEQSLQIWENIPGKLFPLIRLAQIRVQEGKFEDAQHLLEYATPLGEQVMEDIGRAGLELVTCILYNALGDEAHLRQIIERVQKITQWVSESRISRQYQIAAACELAAAHLGLTRLAVDSPTREEHQRLALHATQTALSLYREFGFIQIVECTSEVVLYCHSLALRMNNCEVEADAYWKLASDEMMRKYESIPVNSVFRRTYLDIPLHRAIQEKT